MLGFGELMIMAKTRVEIFHSLQVRGTPSKNGPWSLIAFSRNERTHPNFVLQAPEIEIFCEDCKLAPPLGFFRGFGLVVEYIVPGDEVDACACWLGFFRGFGLVVELKLIHVTPFRGKKIKAEALKKNFFFQ